MLLHETQCFHLSQISLVYEAPAYLIQYRLHTFFKSSFLVHENKTYCLLYLCVKNMSNYMSTELKYCKIIQHLFGDHCDNNSSTLFWNVKVRWRKYWTISRLRYWIELSKNILMWSHKTTGTSSLLSEAVDHFNLLTSSFHLFSLHLCYFMQ